MKKLILLRHAEAEAESANDGTTDQTRALSEHGEQEARAAGQWLAEHDVKPSAVLCSPAARARSTASLALQALNAAPSVQVVDGIYAATPGELLALLDPHMDEEQLVLVGHNPGIEQLVALLVDGRSDDFRGVPPGGLAVLHLDGSLEPGSARLDAFWSP